VEQEVAAAVADVEAMMEQPVADEEHQAAVEDHLCLKPTSHRR
jgi:hypothetical protein